MKIEGDVFYLLDNNNDKHIFNTEQEAIDELKEISTKGEMTPEYTLIFEIDPSGQEWNIQQIPWSKIAMELLGE
jgi:hypothetical protein